MARARKPDAPYLSKSKKSLASPRFGGQRNKHSLRGLFGALVPAFGGRRQLISVLLLIVLLPLVGVIDSSPASASQRSFFSTSTIPAVDDAATTSGLELGLKFRTGTSAYATAIRFYKAAGNTGTHTGYIKNGSQTVLATVTFANESATGWQTAYLSAPVALAASTDYFVSYIAPNGDYSYTPSYFASYTDPPNLTAVQSVFDGDTDPNDAAMANYSTLNYWVDVLVDNDPTTPPTLAQTSYVWQNDDGANAGANTGQAAANTAITGVNRNERLDLRVQLQNSGSQVSESNRFALFYDRSDGYWTKVGQDDVPVTGTGNCDDTAWGCTTVDSGVTVSGTTSTAVAPDGSPWTAYVDTGSGQLRLAHYVGTGGSGCSSSAWTCMVVDSGGAGVAIEPAISLTFTSAGVPWISYQRNNSLSVAKYVGSSGTGCTKADESTTEARWSCVTVDSNTGAGDASAIAIDRNGMPWIAYDGAGGDLQVASFIGTGGSCSSTAWDCTTVHTIAGGGVAGDVALAFATDGKAWVSYDDQTAGDLWVANYVGSSGGCTSSAWDCTSVDTTGTVGAGTSLAFAPNGTAAVSYLDNTSGGVKFAQYDGDGIASGCAVNAWTCSSVATISGTTAFNTSLAFAPDGRPWIAYSDASAGPTANDAKLARYDGDGVASGCASAAWTCTTPQSTGAAGANASLVFDGRGHPWMSHNGGGALKISTVDRAGEINASPSTATLDDAAITSAAAGACSTWRNGRFSVAGEVDNIYLTNGECTELGFSLQTTSAKASTTYRFVVALDNGAAARNHWMGVGSITNYPTLTTSSGTGTRMSKDASAQWTACSGAAAWSCMNVETTGDVGRESASAMDPNGNPWILYHNEDMQELRVAQYVGSGGTGCTSGTTNWNCFTVDGDGSGDAVSSIAFDQAGNPWIAYHHYNGNELRVARYMGVNGGGCKSGSTPIPEWSCTVLANGTDPTIAVDRGGTPWVSWADLGAPNDIHIARPVTTGGTGCVEQTWTCEVVDNAVASNPNMALDAKGNPWISYTIGSGTTAVAHYVGINGNCTNPAWDCSSIETTGSSPTGTSIAIDSQGRAWITTLRNAQNPRYAMYDGDASASGCVSGLASWTCGDIASGIFTGSATSAVDLYGRVWTAFKENDIQADLWLAYYTGVSNSSCGVSGPWQCVMPYTTDEGFGGFPSLLFDQLGTPWVSSSQEVPNRNQAMAKLTLPPGPPSLRNANIANGRNATTGDGRYRLTWGDTARPMSGACDGAADKQGYCGVAVDDTSYDSITAQTNEAPMFNFSVPVADAGALPTATWIGRSSIAASSKTLTLETYKFGTTNAWVSIDTDTACAANTDCTLTGSASGTAADYYQVVGSDTYMYWRVRQDASAGSTTVLKTDHLQAPLNVAPNAPTSLTQKKSNNTTAITTAGWTNENQVRLGASVDDPDASDSLQLCIELKPAATAFDGTGESCASSGAYSGTPLTQSVSQTSLGDNTYHWRARTKDASGATSAWVFYSGSDGTHFGVDTTAPTTTTIFDGAAEDVDSAFNNGSLDRLSANWDAFAESGSGSVVYEYSVGITGGGTTIKGWTSIGTALEINPATGLSLQTGQSYYVNVRATDAAGNATISSSDGQIVAPTLAFAISDPSIDLGSLQPGTVATDTLTMTTSTNAYSGYQVRAKLTQLLTTTAGSTIQNFSAGSYAAPATWGPTDYGLGYTSSDTSIQGLGNHFGTGTLFAPFVTGAGQGNVVADHTATVTSPVINESSDLTIKLAAPLLAIAGVYSTTLVVTAVATF